MPDPQGFIHYSGIPKDCVISGGITVTPGTSPNIATIVCAPFPGPYSLRGVLEFRFGSSVIRMPNSRIVDIEFQTSDSGKQTMLVHVADPRWSWQFGRIRGVYNVREGDQQVRPSREKEPRKLAEMLFDEMGVTRRDVSKLPNDTRPSVDWDGLPAEYLNQLCESLGCRVVYNPLQDRAEIVVVGQGANLPNNSAVLSDSLAVDPAEVPDSLVFLAGATEHQWDFELEPIGRELNGEIKPINDLSYKPAIGWERSCGPPWFDDVAEKHRELAKQCLWRMFRLKLPVTIFGVEVKEIERLLPIMDVLIQTKPLNNGTNERWPAVLFGQFYDGEFGIKPAKPLKGIDGREYQWYTRGFSIDTANGFVMTNEPVYLHRDPAGNIIQENAADPLGIRISPPKLFLRTTVNIRDDQTFAWFRHKVTLKPGGKKLSTKPKFISRDDVIRTLYHHWDGTNLTFRGNVNDVKSEADYYLQQELIGWQVSTPGTRSYDGFVPISLDGAISQVTWQIDDSGRTSTSISRNQEPPSTSLTYKQKRRNDALRAILEAEKANERKQRRR